MGSPLNQYAINEKLILNEIRCDQTTAMKLISMGITVNSTISIIAKRADGAVVIAAGNAKIALGKIVAENLIVGNDA